MKISNFFFTNCTRISITIYFSKVFSKSYLHIYIFFYNIFFILCLIFSYPPLPLSSIKLSIQYIQYEIISYLFFLSKTRQYIVNFSFPSLSCLFYFYAPITKTGIRPGCDLTELDTCWDPKLPYRKQGNKRIFASGSVLTDTAMRRQNHPPLDSTTNSYIPHDSNLFPPTVTIHKGRKDIILYKNICNYNNFCHLYHIFFFFIINRNYIPSTYGRKCAL